MISFHSRTIVGIRAAQPCQSGDERAAAIWPRRCASDEHARDVRPGYDIQAAPQEGGMHAGTRQQIIEKACDHEQGREPDKRRRA